ncbi:MAG: Replication factor C small subunit, partial [Promethearchaeota archaeon]
RVAGEVPPEKIKTILNTALSGKLQLSINQLNELVNEYGLSGQNIIKNIHREIYGLDIPEMEKIDLAKLLAESEYRLSQGGTEEIQLQALLAKIVLLKE